MVRHRPNTGIKGPSSPVAARQALESPARQAVESSQRASDLAAESLRLIDLRYQAGESNALEVVDAQNTATLTSTAFADAQVRYRVALATLQTFTGSF